MGWVKSGHTKWTHGQLWRRVVKACISSTNISRNISAAHACRRGGGCVKISPAKLQSKVWFSFVSFCGEKVDFFYKKHPPPFHFLPRGLAICFIIFQYFKLFHIAITLHENKTNCSHSAWSESRGCCRLLPDSRIRVHQFGPEKDPLGVGDHPIARKTFPKLNLCPKCFYDHFGQLAKSGPKFSGGYFHFLKFFFTFRFLPLSLVSGTHGKWKTPKSGKNPVLEGRTAETGSGIRPKTGELTQRPRFPIRVPIHYWAYLLPFWIYPPRFLSLRHCKDDGT